MGKLVKLRGSAGGSTGMTNICFDGYNMWIPNGNNICRIGSNGISTFTPGGSLNNVCFDGISIWATSTSGGFVYKINQQTGSLITTVSSISAPSGICFDGTYIWVSSVTNNAVYRITTAGVVTRPYSVGTTPAGLCYDGAYVWCACTAGTNGLYKINTSGSIVSQYNNVNLTNVCFDGTYIWGVGGIVGATGHMIKLLALAGSTGLASSNNTTGNNPQGICFDGSNIWYTCNGSNTVTTLPITYGPRATGTTYSTGITPSGCCFDGVNVWVNNQYGACYSKF